MSISIGPTITLPGEKISVFDLKKKNDILGYTWENNIAKAREFGLPYYILAVPTKISSQSLFGPSTIQAYDNVAVDLLFLEWMKQSGFAIKKIHYYVVKLFSINETGKKIHLPIESQKFVTIEEEFSSLFGTSPYFLEELLSNLNFNKINESTEIKEEQESKLEAEDKFVSPFDKIIKKTLTKKELAQNLANFARTFFLTLPPSDPHLNNAMLWLHTAVELLNPTALSLVSDCYMQGKGGLKKDESKAWFYCELLALQGDQIAKFHLSLKYQNGTGCGKDLNQSFSLLKEIVDKGFNEGGYALGKKCLYGTGCKKDLQAAIHYFSLALKDGHPLAQQQIDLCKIDGKADAIPGGISSLTSSEFEHTESTSLPGKGQKRRIDKSVDASSEPDEKKSK